MSRSINKWLKMILVEVNNVGPEPHVYFALAYMLNSHTFKFEASTLFLIIWFNIIVEVTAMDHTPSCLQFGTSKETCN